MYNREWDHSDYIWAKKKYRYSKRKCNRKKNQLKNRLNSHKNKMEKIKECSSLLIPTTISSKTISPKTFWENDE